MEIDQRFNINNEEGKTSELSWVCGLRTGVNRKDTNGWILVEENKECVILCGTMTYWHLVTGAVDIKAKGVWVSET